MTGARRLALGAVTADGVAALAAAIAAARLVCFPTDTVYGVGGLVASRVREAVLAAKGSAPDRPLQVVYPSLELLESSLTLDPRLLDAVRRLLPGPFTLVVPRPADLAFPPPGAVAPAAPPPGGVPAAPTSTLGVRVPVWPDAARVLARLPFALLASSANRSGGAPPGSVAEIDAGLLAACDLVLDAGPVGGTASTVVDLSRYATGGRWRILREGVIDENGVAERLGAGPEGLTQS